MFYTLITESVIWVSTRLGVTSVCVRFADGNCVIRKYRKEAGKGAWNRHLLYFMAGLHTILMGGKKLSLL